MLIALPPNGEIVFVVQASAISLRVVVTPAGNPFATPFAITLMSGSTPQCPMPSQCSPVRPNPVWT